MNLNGRTNIKFVLPKEVIAYILSLADVRAYDLALVCKDWSQWVIPFKITSVEMHDNQREPRWELLTELTSVVYGYDYPTGAKLSIQCPWKVTKLYTCHGVLIDDLAKYSNVTQLSINHDLIINLDQMTQLTHLRISHYATPNAHYFKLTNLTKLHVGKCQITDNVLLSLPKLIKLSMDNTSITSNCISKLTNLQSLRTYEWIISPAIMSLVNLQSLTIWSFDDAILDNYDQLHLLTKLRKLEFTGTIPMAILVKISHLTRLGFDSDDASDRELDSMASATSLRHLNFLTECDIIGTGLAKYTNLTQLGIDLCAYVTSQNISHLTSLTHLTLSHETSITAAEISHICGLAYYE